MLAAGPNLIVDRQDNMVYMQRTRKYGQSMHNSSEENTMKMKQLLLDIVIMYHLTINTEPLYLIIYHLQLKVLNWLG